MGHAFSISPAAVAYREKVLSYVQKPNCDSVWFAVEDSHGGSGRKTCYDASIIKADYIIATIEEAFASWKMPLGTMRLILRRFANLFFLTECRMNPFRNAGNI